MTEKEMAIMKKVVGGLQQKGAASKSRLDAASEHAYEVNRKLLFTLLEDNQDTEYGRKYHFADIKDIDTYRRLVPLTAYDDYESYIDRMTEDGERNLLTVYPIVYYASTSGTSGSPKKIPVTDRGMEVFQSYSLANAFAIEKEFYENTKGHDAPSGKCFILASLKQEPLKDGVNFGSISSAAFNGPNLDLLPYFATTPKEVLLSTENTDLKYLHTRYALAEKNIAYWIGAYIPAFVDIMNYIREHYKELISDIREGRLDETVQMPDDLRKTLMERLTPDPERADELEAAFSSGMDSGIMKRIWPNLSHICAIWAGNFSSYARKLQQYSGRAIPYYTMSYASSESVFGVARHPFDQAYVLTPDSGFFEFIPQDGVNAEGDSDNPKTVLMEELEQGKEYELVITNQSGFYRYRMGDVIKVIGFYGEIPQVIFKYRKKNIVSIAGEKFTEDHLLSAIQEFERITDINIIDFCMYPDRESDPGRYVILMEPETVVPKSRYEECQKVLAKELARASTSYAHYVDGGNMGEPKLIFLQSQTFQLQRELKMYKTKILYGNGRKIRDACDYDEE